MMALADNPFVMVGDMVFRKCGKCKGTNEVIVMTGIALNHKKGRCPDCDSGLLELDHQDMNLREAVITIESNKGMYGDERPEIRILSDELAYKEVSRYNPLTGEKLSNLKEMAEDTAKFHELTRKGYRLATPLNEVRLSGIEIKEEMDRLYTYYTTANDYKREAFEAGVRWREEIFAQGGLGITQDDLWEIYKAGADCMKEHPDDDSYDRATFDEVLEKLTSTK